MYLRRLSRTRAVMSLYCYLSSERGGRELFDKWTEDLVDQSRIDSSGAIQSSCTSSSWLYPFLCTRRTSRKPMGSDSPLRNYKMKGWIETYHHGNTLSSLDFYLCFRTWRFHIFINSFSPSFTSVNSSIIMEVLHWSHSGSGSPSESTSISLGWIGRHVVVWWYSLYPSKN